MNHLQRLTAAFSLQAADRPPILGGWLSAPSHIQLLTGCSEDQYWDETEYWTVKAEQILDSDALIDLIRPVSRQEYRIVDHNTLEQRAAWSVETMLEAIDTLPTPDQLQAEFDEEQEYAILSAELKRRQSLCGDIAWMPANWSILPTALWYGTYGYETSMTVLAWYPEKTRQLIRYSAEFGRLRASLLARAVREGLHLGAILTGEDLCSQQGSMASPKFLRREYWPLVEYSFEPLLNAGAKLIWHCDGNYRQLIDDVLATGVSGLQGFQKECGMDLDWIVNRRTRRNDPLIIFGPLEVTGVLRYGTPEEIRCEVRSAMQLCCDKASLVFFTSNTITPDIPLENIRAYWQAVHETHW